MCQHCGQAWTTAEGADACCVCPQCRQRPRSRRHPFCSRACAETAFYAEAALFKKRDLS